MKKNRKKIIVILLAVIAIMSVISFISGNKHEDRLLVSYESIQKGTIIDDNNIDTLFEEKEVPDTLKSDDMITEKEAVIGKKIIYDISENTIIQNSFIEDIEYTIDTMENPVTMGLRVADISEMVCGCINKGDRIDISVLDNSTGECIDVRRNIYVTGCYNNDGTEIEENESCATYINIIVEKEDEQYINEMMARGNLRICKDGR